MGKPMVHPIPYNMKRCKTSYPTLLYADDDDDDTLTTKTDNLGSEYGTTVFVVRVSSSSSSA